MLEVLGLFSLVLVVACIVTLVVCLRAFLVVLEELEEFRTNTLARDVNLQLVNEEFIRRIVEVRNADSRRPSRPQ